MTNGTLQGSVSALVPVADNYNFQVYGTTPGVCNLTC